MKNLKSILFMSALLIFSLSSCEKDFVSEGEMIGNVNENANDAGKVWAGNYSPLQNCTTCNLTMYLEAATSVGNEIVFAANPNSSECMILSEADGSLDIEWTVKRRTKKGLFANVNYQGSTGEIAGLAVFIDYPNIIGGSAIATYEVCATFNANFQGGGSCTLTECETFEFNLD